MKKALCLIVVLLAMTGGVTVAQQPERPQVVPGHYIVVFADTVADVPGLAYGLAAAHGRSPRFIYEHALKGFAAELPDQAVEALSRNPNVAYIEPDSVVWAIATQSSPTWGLDRIDQRRSPARQRLHLQLHGRRRKGLHHRHRHSHYAQRLWWTRQLGIRLRR